MQGLLLILNKGLHSSTFRITCLLSSVAVVAVGLFMHFEMRELSRRYREATEEPLVDMAHILASLLEAELEQHALEHFPASGLSTLHRDFAPLAGLAKLPSRVFKAHIFDLEKREVDMRVYITDAKGLLLFDSRGSAEVGKDYSAWNDVARTLRGLYGSRTSQEGYGKGSHVTLYSAAPIYAAGHLVGVVSVGKPTRSATQFMQSASDTSLFVALCIVAALVFTSFLIAWHFSRPLRTLKRYVEALRRSEHPALPKLQGYELRSLLEAFEELRVALEGKKYVERYVQTLTHELKSPITAIYGAAELLRDALPDQERQQLLDTISRESQRMRTLVEKLLALSALESGSVRLEHKQLAMVDLLQSLTKSFEAQARQQKIRLELQSSEAGSILADRFWLREAFVTILQNALEFSPADGVIQIVLSGSAQQLQVEILDQGPGVPDWALEKVFDRFFSLERPQQGTRSSGLGLSIAKEIIELHSGSIAISNRSPQGACVRVCLPRATP